jgi:hypothetical protein
MSQPTKGASSRSNRRAVRRGQLRGTARVECRKGSFGLGPNLISRVIDLSETGICVDLQAAAEAGQEYECLFIGLRAGKTVKRVANVVWTQPAESDLTRAGLHFATPLPYAQVDQLVKPPQVIS